MSFKKTMSLNYHISFERFNEHLADICIHHTALSDTPTFSMVTWIAGSYLIREFSKNITTVYYQIGDNPIRHRAEKIDKKTFVLSNVKQGDDITIHYEAYCRDLSVRTAFVDATRIFGNFTSLLLLPEANKHAQANVTLFVPKAFLANHPKCIIACGLKFEQTSTSDGLEYRFNGLAAFEYFDFPFEIGHQDEISFEIIKDKQTCLPHRFFLAGRHHGNLHRLKADLTKICQSYVNWLGDAPFADYTFMTMVTDKDYGGLEHINSTALISPRGDMPAFDEPQIPNEHYQRFLGLCSHEYFHAWWVKTVKPDVMMNNTLTEEAYTPLLWVFEGFTSYIDDLMLLVSGVIDKSSYLKLITAQINRYQQTEGLSHQSVAESSFDAWIKLYRTDENTNNQGISYYNKGALVALLLDMMLMDKTDGKYRLFDVIKACYAKTNNQPFGLTTQILGEIIAQMMGQEAWQDFYHRYVIGVDPLPLTDYFTKFDIQANLQDQHKTWGISFNEHAHGLTINHVSRQSAASHAGLSYDDTIIAIDGLKATSALLNRLIKHQNTTGSPLTVHAFRRDELLSFTINNQKTIHQTVKLEGDGGLWLNFADLTG